MKTDEHESENRLKSK